MKWGTKDKSFRRIFNTFRSREKRDKSCEVSYVPVSGTMPTFHLVCGFIFFKILVSILKVENETQRR